MGAVQAVVLIMTQLATVVLAATTEPTVSPTQQIVRPAPYFYQSGWIPNNSDPGPPPPSNFYPHAPYIFPRVQGLSNTNPGNPNPVNPNPDNTNAFQNSNGYQQPGAISPYGYGYNAYPPIYANPYQFFFPTPY